MSLLKLAAAALMPAAALYYAAEGGNPTPVVAHEWGTFTSVAGMDGRMLQWTALNPSTDLPCFVERAGPSNVKSIAMSTIRMETPVVYFYAPRPTTLSVRVNLPAGIITEWYPKATREGTWHIWNNVEVLPGENLEFPGSAAGSHYYAARNTDAAPLRVNGQQEKLLFYRGVADFGIPVRPKFTSDGTIEVRNSGEEPVASAIVFENHGGKIGWKAVSNLTGTVQVEPEKLTGTVAGLRAELAGMLTSEGLYPKEAQAMLDTWRDSWFEEGLRVLYIVPRAKVDRVLPIQISPAPANLQRVFVGRVEMMSPSMEQSLGTALAAGDTAGLAKFGRFLPGFVGEYTSHHRGARMDYKATDLMNNAVQARQREFASPTCVK